MDTENQIQFTKWAEVAKLPAGGYAVFALNDFGDKRKPVFAATTLADVFDYLRGQFEPPPPKEPA